LQEATTLDCVTREEVEFIQSVRAGCCPDRSRQQSWRRAAAGSIAVIEEVVANRNDHGNNGLSERRSIL
jgi:hypothetical protein